MESPLIYDDLEDGQLKAQFESLVHCMRTIQNMTEEEVIAFLECIRQEVTTTPNLARILTTTNISILNIGLYAGSRLDSEVSKPFLQFLIDTNPSALLWQKGDYGDDHYPINIISSHPQVCTLMPWIATKHQWVLDHENIVDNPPLFVLIRLLQSSTERGIAEIIRQFIDIYPRSLTQKNSDGLIPLHLIIINPGCAVALVKRMVELCPSSMMIKTHNGLAPLHVVCGYVARDPGDNIFKEMCKYLISEYPESVRCNGSDGELPIHLLVTSCQHQAVREVIVCLLRAYPESYDIQVRGVRGSAPSSFPFIQHANSLLVEERALQDNIAQLKSIMGAFDNAVKCTKEDLIKSTCTVFHSWVVLSIQRIKSKIELNLSRIQQACDTWYPNEQSP